MSGQTTVDRAAMQKAAGQIEEAASQIHSNQQNLSNQITALRTGWHGQASDAFYGAYTEFDRQFGAVQQALEEIHGKLVETQRNYTSAEEEQKAASNAINAALNG